MSASQSSNPQTTTTTQTTVSGGAAPTINSGGPVYFTDAGQTENAIKAVTNIALASVDNSMDLLSDFNARQAQSQVSATKDNTDLLSSVLANNQTLAQNVQSGGATTGMNLTTKVIMGALGVVGLIAAIVLFKK